MGESQAKTSAVLDAAKGSVLVIDEGYALHDGSYGQQVLDTLVEKIQGSREDDIAVLLLGYEDKMFEMIRNGNPGLSRRFPIDQAFYFDDFSNVELLEILVSKAKAKGVEINQDFARKAVDALALRRNQANFGNAGAVDTLLQAAVLKACARGDGVILMPEDIDDPGTERME